MKALFERLAHYQLTVNLPKSKLGYAKVKFLWHEIGQGEVAPLNTKIKAICEYPRPLNKKA